MTTYTIAGIIGRFKPLHKGGALMLTAACTKADHVIIGIGSSNKHNLRNPFSADESQAMIEAYLRPRFSNYEFVQIPDSAHIPEYRDGKKWVETIKKEYGDLDVFITGNPYVTTLLEGTYTTIHPAKLIPREDWVRLRATEVRVAMAQGFGWQQYVPDEVAALIEGRGLDMRFRKQYGLETLMKLSDNYWNEDTVEEEQAHTTET